MNRLTVNALLTIAAIFSADLLFFFMGLSVPGPLFQLLMFVGLVSVLQFMELS